MKIELQVCTLEQAKRLNELGIKQGLSIFFYDTVVNKTFFNENNVDGYFNAETCFSLFTVAELGMMLPDGANISGDNHVAQFHSFRICVSAQRNNEKYCCYADNSSPVESTEYGDVYTVWKTISGNTEAEARAAMLIYLLENSLITLEQSKQ